MVFGIAYDDVARAKELVRDLLGRDERVMSAFESKSITSPFPQRDLHPRAAGSEAP